MLARHHAEDRTDQTRLGEAGQVFDGRDEGQADHCADALRRHLATADRMLAGDRQHHVAVLSTTRGAVSAFSIIERHIRC